MMLFRSGLPTTIQNVKLTNRNVRIPIAKIVSFVIIAKRVMSTHPLSATQIFIRKETKHSTNELRYLIALRKPNLSHAKSIMAKNCAGSARHVIILFVSSAAIKMVLTINTM